MKYVFEHWPEIERVLTKHRPAVFLDFDGTLSPLAATPQAAVLPPQTKTILKQLSRALPNRVAIVSGRALKDLKKKAGLKELIYVGNHGLEIEGPRLHYKVSAAKSAERPLRRIKALIQKELGNIEGVYLEDKKMTMSLHYRNVRPKNVARVTRSFKEIVRPYILEKKIRVNPGKKVFEIRPPVDWHKGSAVIWLMRRIARGAKCCPVYVGDDMTDEDAFAAIGARGITVAVGRRRRSKAEYFLKSQREIIRLLQNFIKLN